MEMARSGLSALGDIPWGSHFCHFYRTADDLADALVPFFKAGLQNNEQCIWVTSEPFAADDARAALAAALPDLDERIESGQIEILNFSDWYMRDGERDIDAVLTDWIARKDRALARGYAGLRVSGNTCWIESREQWRSFAEYEAKVDACFREHRILALCSYHLDRCTGAEAMEVVDNHQFAILRQGGEWEMIEKASVKQHKEALRQRSEAALRESEERLATELSAIRQLQDISTQLMHDQSAETLYGKLVDAAALIMGSDFASMQVLHPERGERGELQLLAFRGFDPQAAKFWEWVRADSGCTCGVALRTRQRVIAADVETCDFIVGTSDREVYLRAGIHAVQSTPLFARSGRLLGMISTHWRAPHEPSDADLRRMDVLARMAADLLERSQTESALRDFNASLEARIAERTRELEAAMVEQRKAEVALHRAQRLEAVGQLTGGIAHDFNNLLTIVVGNLDLMRHLSSKSGEISAETLRRLVENAQCAVSRGERLTKQLLAFSRQDSLRLQVLDLHATLDAFAPLLERALGEAIELRHELGDGRWFGKLDLSQFEAAVLNLAINARDAMPKGGALTIETSAISVGAERARKEPELTEGSYVVLGVSDTGSGIEPAVLEKVFEPFFTTKEIGKGTGLGLSQVYGFTKQSGGHVTINSEVGKGTTVRLYLPRSEEAPEVAGEAQEREGRGGSELILVVEDDEQVREVAVEALDSLGYRTVLARNGQEALAVLRIRSDIDLLFTDQVMPGGLSGLELAREARAIRPEMKVLLTSGYPKHAPGNGTYAEDFASIAKPYRRLELAEKIRSLLDRRGTNGVRSQGPAGDSRIARNAVRARSPIEDADSELARLTPGD